MFSKTIHHKGQAVMLTLALIAVLASGFLAAPASLALEDDVNPVMASDLFASLYEQVSPSVVAINVVGTRQEQPQTPLVPEPDTPALGSGSGFVIDKQGHIVTNNHVVEGAERIEVAFFDGTLARAEVVGLDPDSDLAVIQVDLPEDVLIPLEFADSDALRVGETVLALGSPFGQRWTLTSGIISALDRTIRGGTRFSIGGAIQTDASINPGNSGGPLLDLQGRVIGVNSQIVSASRSSAGIGFAIPANLTRRVISALIEQGFVEYSFLGIAGGDVSLSLIETLELPSNTRGVIVSEAVAGGPAARAGLKSMGDMVDVDGLQVPTQVDIITAINGTRLTGMDDLITYLAQRTEPGDQVTLDVLRDGSEQLQVDVTLTPRS